MHIDRIIVGGVQVLECRQFDASYWCYKYEDDIVRTSQRPLRAWWEVFVIVKCLQKFQIKKSLYISYLTGYAISQWVSDCEPKDDCIKDANVKEDGLLNNNWSN